MNLRCLLPVACLAATLGCLSTYAPAGDGSSVAIVGRVNARSEEGPVKVGELETISIGTPHPYSVGGGGAAWSQSIRHPAATYIRVHFSAFDLAPGDRLEISSPSGETHTYTGLGPHGTGEFWAFSVPGDTVHLDLHASTGGAYGFEVDGYGRGIIGVIPSDIGYGIVESVCGTQDWQDVKCYESSRPTEFEKAKGSVLALIGCCSACTGFKVSDNGQFMTNNHCISSQSGVQSTELRFQYQNAECNAGPAGSTGSVFGSQLQKTDGILDYTLFTTTGDSSSIPCLPIDNRLPPVGEGIYIAGHPLGGVKKLSIDSTSDPGGLCQVDASPYGGNDPTSDIGYYCDTTNGSSGSPVLSESTNKVVAIHHFGGCFNSGVRMDRIYPQISGLLGSCGGGGGPTCGNGVIDAGEQCDGSNLSGQTCQSRGYGGGTLRCTGGCLFDESGCTNSVCVPVNGGRCNCNGLCSSKERNYVNAGGTCKDCQ